MDDRFDAAGYIVFDKKFEKTPPISQKDDMPWWGGYSIRFKLTTREKFELLKRNLDKLRIQAQVIDPFQGRNFRIEISKFEYCDGKVEREFDDYTIFVYTLEMCAIEKLRAICQQMPEYELTHNKRSRARDFFDIHAIIASRDIDLSSTENRNLLHNIFSAKQVPLRLLSKVNLYREFHRVGWERVKTSIIGEYETYDYYFDFVANEVQKLKSLWVM